MAKTALERSHSKSSNFKLTLICFFLSLAVVVLWVGIGLITKEKEAGLTLTAVGGVFTLLNLFLVARFTR
ncbi:MAG: hypothetical protein K6G48_01635 [Acholeplasmatales bacterium]|nr:hypothetical protein [Acholeplasmatales bacterium]